MKTFADYGCGAEEETRRATLANTRRKGTMPSMDQGRKRVSLDRLLTGGRSAGGHAFALFRFRQLPKSQCCLSRFRSYRIRRRGDTSASAAAVRFVVFGGRCRADGVNLTAHEQSRKKLPDGARTPIW